MKKYYIEFKHVNSNDAMYDMQSRWFDTKEQAIEWFKQFDYVSSTDVFLMSGDWNETEDFYIDINCERRLNLWDLI